MLRVAVVVTPFSVTSPSSSTLCNTRYLHKLAFAICAAMLAEPGRLKNVTDQDALSRDHEMVLMKHDVRLPYDTRQP